MKPIDILHTALQGVHLIEAGAGTGKTHTIASLFLRMIVEQGLTVDQILVVTYTKAAAEELKGRIRHRLLSAKTQLSAKASPDDSLIAGLLAQGVDRGRAIRRISDALIDFDRAAIFTIHGFCQRVLSHFAFETGHLFQAELVQDAQPFIQEAADDFWRRHISRAPKELVQYILTQLDGPESLAALIHRRRSPQVRVIPQEGQPSLKAIRPWRQAARQVKALWPRHRDEVLPLLASDALNAKSYGTFKPDETFPDVTCRAIKLNAIAASMDQWRAEYPLFKLFNLLSASRLAKATKKNHRCPQHPFFDLCEETLCLCQEMEQQMEAYLRYLKVRLLEEFPRRLAQKKAAASLLFFDDLLLQVHRALHNEQQQALIQAIRNQYQAALVDEFQDTDPLQYDIFIRLFNDPHCLFFMIGDPKQAIYSFRGADLFSYLRAKSEASSQYTLTRNYRSTPGLVQAYNAIFGQRPRPFGYADIGYEPAVAARSDPAPDQVSFYLWYLTHTKDDEVTRPIPKGAAADRIVAAVAGEIVSLLSGNSAKLAPEDIAVLTRTHRQAQWVKAALTKQGVPAVLYSAGSVFESPEAQEIALVLNALANPADPRAVRSALSTDLLGASGHDLCAYMEQPDELWPRRWQQFEHYHQTWRQYGFYRMFNLLMTQESVRPRALTFTDGERRLTNVLHLTELLHQAAVDKQLGPEGLVKWFTAQRQNESEAEDAQKLRLESDAHAVRIITTHKSKGLQFEVVFCPFTWEGARADHGAVTFHDPAHQGRITLAIGPGIDDRHQRLALEEELTENLRLMYVALTRARRRCYLAWGCLKDAELSAPAYLLHGPQSKAADGDWISPLKSKMSAMTDAQLIAELQVLARNSGGAIAVQPLPEPSRARYVPPAALPQPLVCREFTASIRSPWRMASFSSLTAARSMDEIDLPDRDSAAPFSPATHGGSGREDHLFAFPKGARAGLFFHDLLEHYDFTHGDQTQRAQLISAKLERHGFEHLWLERVAQMLTRLADCALPDPHARAPLYLRKVPRTCRVNELEFYFPLSPLTADQLRAAFRQRAGCNAEAFQHALDRLTFAPVQGFLKGYMDMVFEHGGRYYLVDWKSNHLGDAWSDYDPDALHAVMAQDYYFLQYYLYVVALDQFLIHRVPGYDYQHHFGGVYYLFLRGIQGADSATGIYYDQPKADLVAALKEVLIAPAVETISP